jgi:hypothetical protein
MASDFLAGTDAAFFTGLTGVAGFAVVLSLLGMALTAGFAAGFATGFAATLAGALALLTTGADFLAGALAITLLAALGTAAGAGAFLAAVALTTVLDLAAAWAGFFEF